MRYAACVTLKQSDIEVELERFREEVCSAPVKSSREMCEILEHIHQNLFDSDLNVGTIKERCRVRDNNISCRFRRVMGATIKEYIESLRLKAASRLLEKRVPVFDVALSVGYDYPQTFYRAFQRNFECTPASLHQATTTCEAGTGR